ncbi:hypothetical protein RSAG8_03779, partial [Rhizoctonia solani AG-8 WAC10335]
MFNYVHNRAENDKQGFKPLQSLLPLRIQPKDRPSGLYTGRYTRPLVNSGHLQVQAWPPRPGCVIGIFLPSKSRVREANSMGGYVIMNFITHVLVN